MILFDKIIESLYFKQKNNLALHDRTLHCFNNNFYNLIVKTQYKNTETYMTVIDIDNLKKINDKYGHEKGTVMLKGILTCISAVITSDDIIIRYGGDEFIILSKLPINDKLNQLSFIISYGVSYKTKYMSFDNCFSIADKNMYEQKRKKKEKVGEIAR